MEWSAVESLTCVIMRYPPWDVIRKDGDTPSRVQFDDKVYLVAL